VAVDGRLSRSWRIARTGLAFAVFGVGALVVTFLCFPVVRLLSRGPLDRARRAQRVVQRAFRLFTWFMEVLGLIRVSWSGLDRLRRDGPNLVIANHPTLIDVVLLIGHLPQADCVVKEALLGNPFLGWAVRSADYISNGQREALVDACLERLRQGRTLLLFPEGTRSPGGRLGPFRRGAARIALQSGCALLPVVITCQPLSLTKGQRWWDVPERTVRFRLHMADPIVPKDHLDGQPETPLAARQLTAALRDFYAVSLGGADS
jgi:1-acyl-sn-glycerol-3-phosphate acyltransferase